MPELLPPSDITAEMGVIAAVLTNPFQVAQVSYLKPDFFTHPLYRLAWRGIEALTHEGATIEALALEDHMAILDPALMADQGHLLLQATLAVEGFTSARTYAKQVLECAQLRAMILEGQRIVQDAYTRKSARDLGEAVLTRFTRILSVSPDQQTGRTDYPDVLTNMADTTTDRMDNPDHAIRTGYARLDAINGGFEPGELVLIAGRPGSGKSALGASMARRIAGHLHKTHAGCVDMVTLEMSSIAQARRMIAWRSGLDSRFIRQGFLHGNEVDQIAFTHFLATLEKDKADVGDALAFYEGAMTSEQLAVMARQSQAQHGMRVLVIDQLDLLSDVSKEGETARIGQISLNLKRLAMALRIVIICLVQLNRNTEGRNGGEKRPQLADLRQSGRLEMDADIVYGIYRPEYYFPRDDTDPSAYESFAELIPLKYRDGQSGRAIPLRFVKHAGSYDDWTDDFYPFKDMIALVAKKEGRK